MKEASAFSGGSPGGTLAGTVLCVILAPKPREGDQHLASISTAGARGALITEEPWLQRGHST